MTAETSNARGDVVAERQAWYEQQIALAEGQWAAAFLDRWECGDDVPSKEHYVALWLAERAAQPPVSVPLDGLTALDGLVDRIAEAIRDGAGLAEGDPPWERLGEERRAPWRADAKRALSVVKESLTAAGILAARTSQPPDAEVRALPAKWRDRAANNPGSFAAAANVVCADDLEAALAAEGVQPEPKPVLSEPDRIGLYQGPDDCPQLMVNDRPVAIFPAGSWAKVCDALDSITGSVQPDPKPEARGVVDVYTMQTIAEAAAALDKRGDRQMATRLMRLHTRLLAALTEARNG